MVNANENLRVNDNIQMTRLHLYNWKSAKRIAYSQLTIQNSALFLSVTIMFSLHLKYALETYVKYYSHTYEDVML